MKSILQENKECYICETTNWLEEHHVFGGANRKLSEKYGLKIYLCHRHHNEPPDGIHFDTWLMNRVRQDSQKKFMEHYNKTADEFRQIFGKNYI